MWRAAGPSFLNHLCCKSAKIENGSRDLVGCFCILEKVGMLCLEHYIFPNRCYMDCDEEK